MRTEEATEVLARTGLFGGLPEDLLVKVAERGHARTYRKGAAVFFEGDASDGFYVLVEGSVKVFVSSAQGGEMVFATLRPPDTLGEVALLDGGNRSASAEALEPSVLLSFGRSTFLELLAGEPRVADALLRSAGGLIRRLTAQAADLVFLDLEGRVAKLLVGMAEQRGVRAGDALVLDLGVTQGDLAAMVGGSRQAVNHILHALEARGFLRVVGRTIAVSDIEALRRRADL